jgi:hypothetical protein
VCTLLTVGPLDALELLSVFCLTSMPWFGDAGRDSVRFVVIEVLLLGRVIEVEPWHRVCPLP